jgi:hypothetical protein
VRTTQVEALSLGLADAEVRRVAAHIRRAETRARGRPTTRLDPLRRKVRALLLEELAHYRKKARFPKNRDFRQKMPYFIDRDGTRCAMAHLLEFGGERELVARITRERNNAWVRELANEPRLLAWLAAAGLTVDEAAEIQPSYCLKATDCVCGNFSPHVGVLEARVLVAPNQETLVASVGVVAVHGELPAYAVGDELEVRLATTELSSDMLLVPVSPSAADRPDAGSWVYLVGVSLAPDGTYACAQGFAGIPPLTKEQFIAAVRSETCPSFLAGVDEDWAQTTCTVGPDNGAPSGNGQLGTGRSTDGGCSIPGGAVDDPSPFGILAAILAVLAARRRKTKLATVARRHGHAAPGDEPMISEFPNAKNAKVARARGL